MEPNVKVEQTTVSLEGVFRDLKNDMKELHDFELFIKELEKGTPKAFKILDNLTVFKFLCDRLVKQGEEVPEDFYQDMTGLIHFIKSYVRIRLLKMHFESKTLGKELPEKYKHFQEAASILTAEIKAVDIN